MSGFSVAGTVLDAQVRVEGGMHQNGWHKRRKKTPDAVGQHIICRRCVEGDMDEA